MECQVQYETALKLWLMYRSDRNPEHLIRSSELLQDSLSRCISDTGLVAKTSWLYYVVMVALDEANEKVVRKYADYAIALDTRYGALDGSRVRKGTL